MAQCHFLKITFQDGSSYDFDGKEHYNEDEKYSFSQWIHETLNHKEVERFFRVRGVSFRTSDIRLVEFIERFCPTESKGDGTFEECALTTQAQIEKACEMRDRESSAGLEHTLNYSAENKE